MVSLSLHTIGDHDTWLGSSSNGHMYIGTKGCGATPGGVPPDSNAMKLFGRYAKEVRATIPGGRTSHQIITARYDASTGEAEILSNGGNMRCWWQEEEGQRAASNLGVPGPSSGQHRHRRSRYV